jgi:uncharacterized protein
MKASRVMSFLLIYLVILLAVFLLQRKMMYFPARFTQEQQEVLIANASELGTRPSTSNWAS